MKWFYRLLVTVSLVVLVAAVVITSFLAYLFKVYPDVELGFPLPYESADYEIISVDDVYVLLENGLPYPTDFEETTYTTMSLDGVWKIRLDPEEVGEEEGWQDITDFGEEWEDIDIPSTYNYYNGPYQGHEGVTWFVLKFDPSSSTMELDRLKDYFPRLSFSGVLLRSKVWLNGNYLGSHEGGYTPFFFDVSDSLKANEENILIVRCDNRLTYSSLPTKSWDEHSPGWGVYGGIYREVSLEFIPRHYIFKAMVEPYIEGDKGKIEVTFLVQNHNSRLPYIISGEVISPDGTLSEICPEVYNSKEDFELHRFIVEVDDPKPWSPDSPDLYQLDLSLKIRDREETITTKIGFRTLEVRDDGLYINGEKTFLMGICKHEDAPDLGATQDDEIIDRDLTLIQDMGANFIRMAHYPHDVKEIREARDRGLMVSEEIPFYIVGMGWTAWYEEKKGIFTFPFSTFGMKQLNDVELMLLTQRQLIEMVERDRNNPAVIIWFVANESYTLFEDAGVFYGWMREVIRAFDDTRPVTMAEITYDIPQFDNRRTTADFLDFLALNSYYGWYYGSVDDVDGYLDSVHSINPDKLIMLSEFGASAGPGRRDSDGIYKAERVSRGKTYSEDYQDMVIRVYVETALTKDYVIGVSPWVFADFLCPWFPNNPVPDFNCKGVVTRDRVPKMSYYSLKEIYEGLKGE